MTDAAGHLRRLSNEPRQMGRWGGRRIRSIYIAHRAPHDRWRPRIGPPTGCGAEKNRHLLRGVCPLCGIKCGYPRDRLSDRPATPLPPIPLTPRRGSPSDAGAWLHLSPIFSDTSAEIAMAAR